MRTYPELPAPEAAVALLGMPASIVLRRHSITQLQVQQPSWWRMLSLQLSCCRWCCREGQCGWRPHVSAQSFSKLHVLTFSLRFGHPVLHATRRCHLLGWAPHPSRQCRQDFAQSLWPMWQMSMMPATTQSVSVSVFSVENATQSPGISSNTRDNACGAVGLCSWPKRLLWNGWTGGLSVAAPLFCSRVQKSPSRISKTMQDKSQSHAALFYVSIRTFSFYWKGPRICSPLGALSGHIGPPMQGLTGKPMARPMSAVYNFSNGWKHCTQSGRKTMFDEPDKPTWQEHGKSKMQRRAW